MMETLGVAAIVIAVVDLSAKVASLCCQYAKAVKDAPDDVARLQREADGLEKALKRVRLLLDGPSGARLQGSQEIRDILDDCRPPLEKLAKKLDPGKTRKTMSLVGIRALKWPLKSKDVKKTAQDLGNKRQAIFLYLQTYMASLA
jgi:hypothetical protein